MKKCGQVYIYNPSLKTGGTNNLLASLAVLLANTSDYEVNYIDYNNSPVLAILKQKTNELNYIEYKPKIALNSGILITTLLDIKNIRNVFILSENIRLIFWSTHPEDGLKILPSFNIWIRKSDSLSKLLAKIMHPLFKKRIKKFIETGSINNGIVWMDQSNYLKNRNFYNLTSEANYWPIFTTIPNREIPLLNDYKENFKIVILGRLTNFKTYPLYGLLDQISEYQKSARIRISINFIGDGPLRILLEKWLIEKGITDYKFLGHIDLKILDQNLMKSHILIGMGTAVLEGSKLKIPSLLMNASYEYIFKENFRLQWISDVEPYCVGKFISNTEGVQEGKTFAEIMNEIQSVQDLKYFGNKSYLHWKAYHSPEAIHGIVLNTLNRNTFYYTMQNQKLLKRDLFGYLIDKLKSLLK